MKIKIRHPKFLHIFNPLHPIPKFPHRNIRLVPPLKLLSCCFLQQFNRAGDSGLQFCERRLVVCARRQRSACNDNDEVFGDVAYVLDLENERVHVGCESPVQDFGFRDAVGFGVGRALRENIGGILEGTDVHWYKYIVNVD